MLTHIKSSLLVFGCICVVLLPGFFIFQHYNPSVREYAVTHAGLLQAQYKWVLASQKQNYSSLQSAKEWFSTTAWIYYQWQSENEYGIDFKAGNWDWQLHYSLGVATVTVPRLEYFGPKINLDSRNLKVRVINGALGIDESKLIEKYFTSMQDIAQLDGQAQLGNPYLIEVCRRAVAEQVLNMLNQSNSSLKVHKVNVLFADYGL